MSPAEAPWTPLSQPDRPPGLLAGMAIRSVRMAPTILCWDLNPGSLKVALAVLRESASRYHGTLDPEGSIEPMPKTLARSEKTPFHH